MNPTPERGHRCEAAEDAAAWGVGFDSKGSTPKPALDPTLDATLNLTRDSTLNPTLNPKQCTPNPKYDITTKLQGMQTPEERRLRGVRFRC